MPKAPVSPEMGPKGKKLSRSVSNNDFIMETFDSQRKQKFVDEEGSTHSYKITKVRKMGSNQNFLRF